MGKIRLTLSNGERSFDSKEELELIVVRDCMDGDLKTALALGEKGLSEGDVVTFEEIWTNFEGEWVKVNNKEGTSFDIRANDLAFISGKVLNAENTFEKKIIGNFQNKLQKVIVDAIGEDLLNSFVEEGLISYEVYDYFSSLDNSDHIADNFGIKVSDYLRKCSDDKGAEIDDLITQESTNLVLSFMTPEVVNRLMLELLNEEYNSREEK